MKKFNLLFIAFILTSTIASAQFTVEDYNGVPIVDGDVRTFNTLVESEATLYFWIHNNTSSDINMMVKNESITNSDGSNFQFCFGTLCMFDVIEGQTYPMSGTPEVIEAGGTNPQFDKFYNENPGDGTNYPIDYVFKFMQVDNNNNEIGNSITFTYRYDPNAMSTESFKLNDLGVAMKNTIVTDNLYLTSTSNVTYAIYDLNGRLVNSAGLSIGDSTISTGQIGSGLYLINFSDEKGNRATAKFIKK